MYSAGLWGSEMWVSVKSVTFEAGMSAGIGHNAAAGGLEKYTYDCHEGH